MVPDVVTMNIAHSTHYTLFPDPRIAHVLHGWSDSPGEKAEHFLTVGEVLVRNMTTDIRSYGSVEADRNSIFIFEIAGLCLGHLGHLHQTLSDSPGGRDRAGSTWCSCPSTAPTPMDQRQMMEVVAGGLRAQVAIPMHWWSTHSLRRFAEQTAADGIAVEMRESPTFAHLAQHAARGADAPDPAEGVRFLSRALATGRRFRPTAPGLREAWPVGAARVHGKGALG